MIKYYNSRAPSDADGAEGDIAVVNTGRAIYLYVKAKRQWYQTQQLEPKSWGISNLRKMNGFLLMSDIVLNGKYISGSGRLHKGLTVDAGTDQVHVNTDAGLKVSDNIYLKGQHGKVIFDGEAGDDYIISSGDGLDFYAGGEGILRINEDTSDGIVLPIGKKLIFSMKNLGDDSGDADDDNFYISRPGSEGAAGTTLDIYTMDTQAITMSTTVLNLKPDNYELRFNDGSYHTGFKAHATMTASAMYTLPPAYPADASNKFMISNGSGAMGWSNAPVTAISGATENELVTIGSTTTELVSEENLTFDGTTLSTSYLEVGDLEGAPSSYVKQSLSYVTNTVLPVALDFFKSRGTVGSLAPVASGDYLGTQRYFGYDGDSYHNSSAIRGNVDASVSDAVVPGMLDFLTAPGATLVSRMVIDSGGYVGIGSWNPSSKPHNMLSVDGTIGLLERSGADTDAATYGQIWIKSDAPNTLWFTDDDGDDYPISGMIHTAVFGGGLGRTTGMDDTWLGIPCTGHQYAPPQFGTDAAEPVTIYSPSNTADDLLSCIWQPAGDVQILSCKLRFAQGGGTNTSHIGCLMKYRMGADGDLTGGVVVGVVETESTSADYSHLVSLDLTITAGNATTDIATYDYVFIAMVYCPDGISSGMNAQCTLGYKHIVA